jgi:hypothetical protein
MKPAGLFSLQKRHHQRRPTNFQMLNLCEMDNSVPGGVYLCQINERVSCGACCGLYNVADVSSEELTEILIRRTEAFERISRDGVQHLLLSVLQPAILKDIWPGRAETRDISDRLF